MTPQAALIELLDRVGSSNGAAVLVDNDELGQWPSAAVTAMKSQKLLVKARPATSATCPGCERNCAMSVHTLPATAGAPLLFIACDKRSDINRVAVPAKLLIQWQSSVELVCRFVAASLWLRLSHRQTGIPGLREIGVASGDKRSQMICLQDDGVLTLVAGGNKMPLADLIEYHGGAYSLDGLMIRRLVDAATTADHRYTPSNARREARKLDTQAIHDGWRKEYRRLTKQHPDKSDAWCAQRIAKMVIAHGRDAETIRKQMKK
jgi:hypothetical protein